MWHCFQLNVAILAIILKQILIHLGASNDTLDTLAGDLCAHCPDACNSKAFDLEMSFATLSSLSVQQLLSDEEGSLRLGENFKVALGLLLIVLRNNRSIYNN